MAPFKGAYAGAESEPEIALVFAGEIIGRGGYSHGGRMTGHVPAVGQQGHGTEKEPGHNLHDHRHEGQRDDDPCAPLMGMVMFREKIMTVGTLKSLIIRQKIDLRLEAL